MENHSKWIDITFPITSDLVTWPGDAGIGIDKTSEIGVDGAKANVTSVAMSAHTGTHIDAPLHFIAGGGDVASLDLATLVGPVRILEIRDSRQVTREELEKHHIREGERLIFKTVNSLTDWSRQPFMKDYVHLSTGAAQYLVTLKIRTVGVDYLSVGGPDNGVEVHLILLGAGITILEGLMIKDIDPGQYEMVALPMKIAGADGAPARVIIRRL